MLSIGVITACCAFETLASVNYSYAPDFAKIVMDMCLACKMKCDKFPQYSSYIGCSLRGEVGIYSFQ
jgi:hypothetical protein